jgi:hypothetical protein
LGWQLAYACVGFLVTQYVANQEPFVEFGTVPVTVSREGQDQPFTNCTQIG